MRYIQRFANSNAVQTAIAEEALGKPYIAYLNDEHRIDWNSISPVDYSREYLTFVITSPGILKYSLNGYSPTPKALQINYNDTGWQPFGADITGSTMDVYEGDIIKVKGNHNSYMGETFEGLYTFGYCTCGFYLQGNIMSLIYGDNFIGQTTFPANSTYQFQLFFESCTGLTSVENLILPATTLADACYSGMFRDCTNLTTGPSLPATTLASYCYSYMFFNCDNINYIKCLATDISASDCTQDWLDEISVSNGTFVKNPNMSSWTTGKSGIPTNWTVEDADI